MASFDQFEIVETREKVCVLYLENRFYVFPDDSRLPILQHAVWCNSCNSVTVAEYFTTDADIDEEREALLATTRGELTRYFPLINNPKEVASMLQELDARQGFLKRRTSPARCLSCFDFSLCNIPNTIGEVASIPNGHRIRYVGYGFADVGIEKELLLTLDGLRIA